MPTFQPNPDFNLTSPKFTEADIAVSMAWRNRVWDHGAADGAEYLASLGLIPFEWLARVAQTWAKTFDPSGPARFDAMAAGYLMHAPWIVDAAERALAAAGYRAVGWMTAGGTKYRAIVTPPTDARTYWGMRFELVPHSGKRNTYPCLYWQRLLLSAPRPHALLNPTVMEILAPFGVMGIQLSDDASPVRTSTYEHQHSKDVVLLIRVDPLEWLPYLTPEESART